MKNNHAIVLHRASQPLSYYSYYAWFHFYLHNDYYFSSSSSSSSSLSSSSSSKSSSFSFHRCFQNSAEKNTQNALQAVLRRKFNWTHEDRGSEGNKETTWISREQGCRWWSTLRAHSLSLKESTLSHLFCTFYVLFRFISTYRCIWNLNVVVMDRSLCVVWDDVYSRARRFERTSSVRYSLFVIV